MIEAKAVAPTGTADTVISNPVGYFSLNGIKGNAEDGVNDPCFPDPDNPEDTKGWDQGAVYDKAWGLGPAHVVPQIYNTAGAQAGQWDWISEWGLQNAGGEIYFSGVLTQR